MKRPKLNKIILAEVLGQILNARQGFYITMSVDQWDSFLVEAYFRQGATLIELNDQGIPTAAYRKH